MPIPSYRNTYLLSALEEDELDKLLETSSEISFRKGEIIYKQGTFVNGASYLVSGYARIYVETGQKNRTLKIVKPNWFIGLLSIFSHDIHRFSAMAIEDCTVLHFKNNVLDQMMRANAGFAHRMTHVISLLATDLAMYQIGRASCRERV